MRGSKDAMVRYQNSGMDDKGKREEKREKRVERREERGEKREERR